MLKLKMGATALAVGSIMVIPTLTNQNVPTKTTSSTPNVTYTSIGPEPPTRSPYPPAPLFPQITALSIGDSLTVGIDGSAQASYRMELSRLMTRTGQPYVWQVAAAGGSKCSYWAERIDNLITLYHPTVIFLDCGTNDTPDDNTESDYRYILNAATTANVKVVAGLIVPPDMKSETNKVRPYIIDWMHATNDAIKRALVDYPQVAVAELKRVPANPEWLKSDGIHWNTRAETGVGQIFYQAAQPSFNWKTLSQIGTYEICGLSGSWPDEPWPTNYRVCMN